SQLLAQSKPVQIYNPFSTDSGGNRAPFSGNLIPASLLSPAGLNILSSSFYPLPTTNGLLNNLAYSPRSYVNGDQGDIRIDYDPSDKDHIFGRYSQSMYANPAFRSFDL